MKTQVIIVLTTLTLIFPTILFGQTAIFSADTLHFYEKKKYRLDRYNEIMEAEWRINGQTLHYGSEPLSIRIDHVLDTIYFKEFKNSKWDTLICNITEPKKYIFYHNECCGGFNISDGKFINGSVNFSIKSSDTKRLYLGTLGETGLLVKQKNQILKPGCRSPMFQNVYSITFSEIEISKDTSDRIDILCLYEEGKEQLNYEFAYRTISLKLDFLFLPLSNQPIKVTYIPKTGKIKIE